MQRQKARDMIRSILLTRIHSDLVDAIHISEDMNKAFSDLSSNKELLK